METIAIAIDNRVARITLNRPAFRNAFNDAVIRDLCSAFSDLSDDVRAVILTGAGTAFCAGADLNWMREAAAGSSDDNARDAREMAHLFEVIDRCPKLVIGRVNGAAMGGGLGLLSVCDVVVAVDTASFAFSEVRLGVVPAVISPFVLRKMPVAQARRYFLTGERFNAATAETLGLVHKVCQADQLEAVVDHWLAAIQQAGPCAVAEAKALLRRVQPPPDAALLQDTAAIIARLRSSYEAREGFSAFLDKRAPRW
jgi:methylglutaconyl-CoA hydratase